MNKILLCWTLAAIASACNPLLTLAALELTQPPTNRASVVIDREDWRGYTTTSRVRLLDSIPFQTALKHNMEIWNWADTHTCYFSAYDRKGNYESIGKATFRIKETQ